MYRRHRLCTSLRDSCGFRSHALGHTPQAMVTKRRLLRCLKLVREGFLSPAPDLAAVRQVSEAVDDLKRMAIQVDVGSGAAKELFR